jgi:hypothetical protein
MLLPNQSTSASGSSTDILTIEPEELDSNSFTLFVTESIEIQPDLSGVLTGNQNSLVSTRQICCSIDWIKLCSMT